MLAAEVGKAGFAWLVRHVLTYDTEKGEWISMDMYLKDSAEDIGIDPDSPLAKDPVKVGVDLMFGNPSVNDILDMVGWND